MPRAYTKEQVREELLDRIHSLVDYWYRENSKPDTKDKLSGLAFSILGLFDGTAPGFPSFDISCSPHPDDREFRIRMGENWYESGMVINGDCMLHELFCKKE